MENKLRVGRKMNIDVIYSEILSGHGDSRYIIVDKDTGEIIDDAQGYGYKSKQGAYAAYSYKNRDRSKDDVKAQKKKAVKEWCRQNKDFVSRLEDDAFQIAKGSYGPEDKFNAKWVTKAFEEAGYIDLPFTSAEFLKYW